MTVSATKSRSMNILNWRTIGKCIALVCVVELASFFSFNNPLFTSFFFALACAITFVVAWKDLRYGLLIAFGELFIGSQGYLFILERHGSHVPIRMGIFGVIMLVWLLQHFKWNYWKEQIRTSRVVQLFLVFMGVWTLGVLVGLGHHNSLANIISDSNAYLYWLLFLPVWQESPLGPYGHSHIDFVWSVRRGGEATPSRGGLGSALNLLAASIITTTTKTAFTWYIFSKQIFSHDTLEFIYKWIRDTRVGEIVTYDRGGYVRVFFQSHIFELLGLFIFLSLLIYSLPQKHNRIFLITYFLLSSFSLATVLMSLSRSFWLAGIVTFGLMCVFFFFQITFKKFNVLSLTWKQFVVFLISCFFISIIALCISTLAGATAIGSRATTKTEAALSSRWKLLPPLLAKTTEHPVFGSGFGTTVTYQSDDPRIKNNANPEGWYTTYAFEWGYLDIITKIGAFGLAVYLVFIWSIAKRQFAELKSQEIEIKYTSLGLCAGLVALCITHMFTPYLNHPLGIGYILLLTAELKR